MNHLANFIRFLADIIDSPHKTRYIHFDGHTFAMRDDLPFVIRVDGT